MSAPLDCQHVTRVLRSQTYAGAGVPIGISDADVQAIRLAQDTGQFDEMRVATVKPGDRLELHEDAFTGQAGTVGSVGDDKIVLLISAMGRELRTVAPVERVKKVG